MAWRGVVGGIVVVLVDVVTGDGMPVVDAVGMSLVAAVVMPVVVSVVVVSVVVVGSVVVAIVVVGVIVAVV